MGTKSRETITADRSGQRQSGQQKHASKPTGSPVRRAGDRPSRLPR